MTDGNGNELLPLTQQTDTKSHVSINSKGEVNAQEAIKEVLYDNNGDNKGPNVFVETKQDMSLLLQDSKSPNQSTAS